MTETNDSLLQSWLWSKIYLYISLSQDGRAYHKSWPGDGDVDWETELMETQWSEFLQRAAAAEVSLQMFDVFDLKLIHSSRVYCGDVLMPS